MYVVSDRTKEGLSVEKYIIKVNGKEYHSYKELYDDFDIYFGEWVKHNEKDLYWDETLSGKAW